MFIVFFFLALGVRLLIFIFCCFFPAAVFSSSLFVPSVLLFAWACFLLIYGALAKLS